MNKVTLSLFACMGLVLVSCAAGSATSAFALRAHEAECLSARGEQHIVDRTKREIMTELSTPYCPPVVYPQP